MRRIAWLCVACMSVAAGSAAASTMVPTKRSVSSHGGSTHRPVHRRTKSGQVPKHQRDHPSSANSGADPLLVGNASVLSQGASDSAGQAEAVQQTATITGTVQSISLYIAPSGGWNGSSGPRVVLGLYSDHNGKPGTLLTSGSATQNAGSWVTATVPNVSVTAGTKYWLALLSPSGSVYFFTSPTANCGDVGSRQTNLSYLHPTFTTGPSWGNCPASIHADGTAASPSPPPTPVPPSNTAAPTISGTPQQGDTLTASPGKWNGDTPMSFSYKWSDGTTGPMDALPVSDVGQMVSVTVTATNDAGSAQASSTAIGPVSSPPTLPPPPPPPPPGNCTVTVSSVGSVNTDLTPGAVVCLAAGSYGGLSISASPSSNATVTAAPAAHVVVSGVTLTGSNITVSQLHSTGGITISNGGSNDTIDHNDVTNSSCGYGIAVFGTYTGSSFNPVANHDTISWNKIHDTGTTCEADALRIQGYANITIVHNDEYNLADPHQYHTDTLQSYQAGVPTSGLVYSYNYAHDLANAGPPFLKDGDVQNVTVTDNLVLRNSWAGIGGMDLHENTTGLVFRNNTYLGTSGTVVQGQGSAPNPSLLFDHNVIDNANQSGSTGYTITSDYNDFVDSNEYSWPRGAHDTLGTPVGGYKCGSSCGNGAAAGDDYELAVNPNGIGIDWSPANQQYGPATP